MKLGIGVLSIVLSLPCLSAAQVAPFPPLVPNDPKQCAQFAKESADFFGKMQSQHEQCLAQHKADQEEKARIQPRICSRSACQRLHDLVYGDEQMRSAGALDECYKYLKDQADYKAKWEKIVDPFGTPAVMNGSRQHEHSAGMVDPFSAG